MKKALLTKLMLLLCALIAGSSSVWAGYETSYTFQTARNSSNTAYASNYDVTISEITWSVPGNQNYEGYVRIGGKGLSNVDRVISSKGTISADISKITFNHGGKSNNSLTVNSVKLTVASNANFSTIIEEITVTPTIAVSTASSFDFKAGDSGASITSWGANRYYKFTINVSNSNNSNNYGFDVKSIVFYNYVESGKTTTSLAWSANTYSFYQGDAYTLPTLTPSPATIASDITYNSSNTAVASIAANGTVTINGLGSTIITASYAGDATYEAATDASYTLNVYGIFTTMAELQAGCTAYGNTSMKGKMTFNNVYVTAVKGNNAYISDGTNGAVIYKNGNGFAAGDKLSCSALEMDMINYSNYTPEITSLTKTTEGLTVTSGNEITPTSLAVNAITAANFGTLVKITSVTYDATNKVFKDASSNEIAYYDNFSASPTLIDGEEYDVTGIILFKNNTTVEICPRTAADVTPKVVKTNPGTKWYTDNTETSEITTITINKIDGDVQYFVSTAYTGAISYESSDESVATIANDGTISPVGYGTTTIKASTPATDAFFASEASFTLTVKDDFVDLLLPGNITFATTGYSAWSSVSNLWSGATYAGNTNNVSTKIQLKVDNSVGIVVTGSAGRVKKISIAWNSGTTTDRTLNIYGTNTPYTTVAVGANEVSLGSFSSNNQSVTELTVDNDKNYGYIRIAAAGGALYLDKIQIEWDKDVVPMSVSDATWASFSSAKALDFTGTNVTAYIAKEKDASNVTLSEIAKVPASTGIVVNAPAGTYAIPVLSGDADATTGNLLQPWLTAGTPTAGTYYTLAAGPTFKKSSGGTLAAGKAYLDLFGATAPVLNISFENGDVTGVKDVRSKMEDVRGDFFDLQGRKVVQPTKGLYIQSGRKVILK